MRHRLAKKIRRKLWRKAIAERPVSSEMDARTRKAIAVCDRRFERRLVPFELDRIRDSSGGPVAKRMVFDGDTAKRWRRWRRLGWVDYVEEVGAYTRARGPHHDQEFERVHGLHVSLFWAGPRLMRDMPREDRKAVAERLREIGYAARLEGGGVIVEGAAR